MKKLLALTLTIMFLLSMWCTVGIAEEGVSGSITYMCWGSTVERDIVQKKRPSSCCTFLANMTQRQPRWLPLGKSRMWRI